MAKNSPPPVQGPRRNTLPGGHKNRRVPPTEVPRLKRIVKKMGKKHITVKHPDPAPAEQRNNGRFKKGHHQGRPKGSTNVVPAGVKASVRAILEEVVRHRKKTVRDAIVEGIQSGPRHADRYLRLAAEYVDGKPTDNVNLNARFNQDELGSAREMLGKKLTGMLAIILERDGEK